MSGCQAIPWAKSLLQSCVTCCGSCCYGLPELKEQVYSIWWLHIIDEYEPLAQTQSVIKKMSKETHLSDHQLMEHSQETQITFRERLKQ
jgi:hypothetical protein